MKKDKQYIINYLNTVYTSNLHFAFADCFENLVSGDADKEYFEERIKKLKECNKVNDRVIGILNLMEEFATFDESDKFQCRSGANRSALDIWRVYNNYFRPVSIFYIMRTLYKLVIEEQEIMTIFCNDIHKQVFFIDDYDTDIDSITVMNEFNLTFAEWRTVGL